MDKSKSGFAHVANSCTPDEYKKVAREFPEPLFASLNFVSSPEDIAVICECFYRVTSLIAFGNNLAGIEDIKQFTVLPIPKAQLSPNTLNEIKVLLPYYKDELLERSYIEIEYVPESCKALRPYDFKSVAIMQECESYWAFTLTFGEVQNDNDLRMLVRFLGALIANHFASPYYVMYYDGVPKFRALNGIHALWLDLAQLKFKESPGICPVCGRVIDRRRSGTKGGQPQKACSKPHMDSWQNEQKRLHKMEEFTISTKAEREDKAREMRWQDGNDSRPYQFLGVEGLKERLDNTSDINIHED